MTPHLWPLRSYLELGALPTAVPCARLHARQLVWEWGLNGLAANTELLVSELVTNAVKTTAGNNDQAAICLQLSGDNTRVLVEVWDADPQPPVLKDLGEDGTPDPQEEGGRGLCLIAALSTRWAWYLTEKPTGKVVWCELSAEPPELSESARSAPQALLPRGVPCEQQKTAERGDARSGHLAPTPGSSPRPEPCRTPQRRRPASAGSVDTLAL
jgi:anti-sigma regulatory factor (Ser/Thr protein kinase)